MKQTFFVGNIVIVNNGKITHHITETDLKDESMRSAREFKEEMKDLAVETALADGIEETCQIKVMVTPYDLELRPRLRQR